MWRHRRQIAWNHTVGGPQRRGSTGRGIGLLEALGILFGSLFDIRFGFRAEPADYLTTALRKYPLTEIYSMSQHPELINHALGVHEGQRYENST